MRSVRAGLAACLVVALCPPAGPAAALSAPARLSAHSGAPVAAARPPSTRQVHRARRAVRQRSKELGVASAALVHARSRLDELTASVERLVEAYNGEMVRMRQANQAYDEARARLASADAEVESGRRAVAVLAAESYGGFDLSRPLLLLMSDTGDYDGYLHRASVLEEISGERALVLDRMRDAQAVAGIMRAQAADAYAEQQAASRRAEQAKIAADRAVARQREETRSLRRELHGLERRVDAARSRADRLAREREAARQARLAGLSGGLVAKGSAGGDLAANWALTQLGKPYVWAAAGPSTYDCSGLTMRAWEQVGVRLDHWTGTQWTSGPHVPLDQLHRGDLLFFGYESEDPGTIHHVGIYVGDGMMVHAPQTGDVVRVASMWRPDLVGATRPA
ncbi:NlpC/P60 family protein [Nonomuraea sp. 3-1Str]|uniref:C40 family peptidase n=1 Tax=unclassified Nonomuraea TaxID=2593643 RepID=UPI00285C69D5|nr:NlpC/P60 family protein [Nonomuraea sp. 3-1Str]MDR8408322.1 NlpC/P60 family protein [Nonomuraea sp. 3-1Str]